MQALGDVGTLGGAAAEYAAIWRIVAECRVPLFDIEQNWTLERILAMSAYLEMKNDYKSAWTDYYEHKGRNNG